MIIGLVGPSCSGKSFFLNLLQNEMGFYIPIGITTRKVRKNSNGKLLHIDKGDFIKRELNNELCFVTEFAGNKYAYSYSDFITNVNLAIEIRRENIPEIRNYGKNLIVKIMPCNLNIGIEKICQERFQGIDNRKKELMEEYKISDDYLFDFVLKNHYNNISAISLLNFVRENIK